MENDKVKEYIHLDLKELFFSLEINHLRIIQS